ncbi:MAG: DoxX family protein, partial [Xanthomarina sp.]
VKDFSIETDDEDFTEYYLSKDNLIIIAMYNLDTAEKDGVVKLKAFSDEALSKGYTVIGLTASGDASKKYMKDQYKLNFDFFLCDEKAIKTVVRASPGIVKLEKGTVTQKVHWNDLEKIKLPEVDPEVEELIEKVVEITSLYLVDGEPQDKIYVDQIAPELIESVNIIKDTVVVRDMGVIDFDSVVEITLKKK